ncbi:phenazine biosynthesis protein PhzF [Rhodanobacter sp. FW510-R12]|uniref:PhzF family phenazine biosynthesis protein n=1 Tax=unclassified Rhodanobacter TaxID=2621553 RepID=UPI0007AA3EB0|nr:MULTISPECIES: PhzF family phenazine biosynthesis protein [unclassified Rhodanobacter]KZC15798.1 phenazine biosynthesis protein PhzF [Rhodanobacter sp. FW104-R8]KZC26106.1 phenazine biosynthesis protein PhzF [Rhodanobacter sp. FW510-T8]KZC30354.1 phenazine biosynthesis protein PhzF [Rhodanobacter sp. FW510-R10]
MPTPRRFMQLDVFASRLFDGNPLAVVIDADGLDTTAMQRIAQWTNLSETTFLLPPTSSAADYRVRIFTPRQELPFAGHPSVGSAWVAIEAGLVAAGKTALVQECAAGLLPVQVAGSGAQRLIRVQAPPARIDAADAALHAALARALRIGLAPGEACHVDNGPHWILGNLGEAAAVRGLQPDLAAVAALCLQQRAVGVGVFGREHAGGAAMAVRAFCPADGIPEDPVTGSANAAIMAWLGERGDRDGYGLRYRASQGREVGRDGIVEVARDLASGAITIGGACAIGVRGDLQLP